jgi:arginyl-tRNA synthetase
MILTIQRHVHDAVTAAIRQMGMTEVPSFAVETPPRRAMGDLAVAVAFQLARPLKKAPRVIAEQLAQALGPIRGVARVSVAPNGYLNFYLDRPAFLLERLRGEAAGPGVPEGKTVVEHTAINPNKAAHVGHLRNATLGDTLVRVLRFRGVPVEVQNYIDDTGVQVADVVVGLQHLEHLDLAAVRRIADTTRFDYYCWDLYARTTEWYDQDKANLTVRAETLHALEAGGNATADLGALVVERIVHAHLRTMARLNVGYDLLTYEGDILRLKFWATAFDILKASGAVFLQTEGRLAGCWVMRIDEDGPPETTGAAGSDAGSAADPSPAGSGDAEGEAREKVIVRSNGVVTYVGKDIANQFWKFGLLGRDFLYARLGDQANQRPLWATTSHDGQPDAPSFGKAQRIYNVIDSRQLYLQALLSQALRVLGHEKEARNSIHFSYEMVALSLRTARELGFLDGGAAPGKPFVEVSGRKGLGVKIDDLLDLLIAKAVEEVGKRNPEIPDADRQRVASQIAVAAIRYFMLKFSRGKLIVFDIEEALSFEGETGPYLQYAVVRANNIFNKLRDRDGVTEAALVQELSVLRPDELVGATAQTEPTGKPGHGGDDDPHDLWSLVFEAARLDEVVEQVVQGLEFAGLAKYAFGLAQAFNAFYHRYPILIDEDRARKYWRAAGVAYARDQLTKALDLMGLEVPIRM